MRFLRHDITQFILEQASARDGVRNGMDPKREDAVKDFVTLSYAGGPSDRVFAKDALLQRLISYEVAFSFMLGFRFNRVLFFLHDIFSFLRISP